jgi:hypothetical protein
VCGPWKLKGRRSRRKKNGFRIIIAKTRGACVIAIIWLGQELGRHRDGLKEINMIVSWVGPCVDSLRKEKAVYLDRKVCLS